MKTLAFYLKIYVKLVSQYIKTRMEYRVDFIIGFIGMVFWNITGILTLWVIFRSIPLLAGWNYFELVFMYGFTLLALTPYELFFVKLNDLRWDLVTGKFIKYYFRPLNMMFYYMSDMFELKTFGQLALGIIIIVYASINLNISWNAWKVALIIIMFISASMVVISLMLLAAFSAFWILNSFPIVNFIYKLRDVARYPLSIFNNFFRFLFTYMLPVGFIAYYPLQALFRPVEVHPVAYFSPFIGVLLFVITCLVWRKGVNSYSGTGS
jgi:ABC-2 type transport system permease protein